MSTDYRYFESNIAPAPLTPRVDSIRCRNVDGEPAGATALFVYKDWRGSSTDVGRAALIMTSVRSAALLHIISVAPLYCFELFHYISFRCWTSNIFLLFRSTKGIVKWIPTAPQKNANIPSHFCMLYRNSCLIHNGVMSSVYSYTFSFYYNIRHNSNENAKLLLYIFYIHINIGSKSTTRLRNICPIQICSQRERVAVTALHARPVVAVRYVATALRHRYALWAYRAMHLSSNLLCNGRSVRGVPWWRIHCIAVHNLRPN